MQLITFGDDIFLFKYEIKLPTKLEQRYPSSSHSSRLTNYALALRARA